MSVERSGVLQVAPNGSRWNILGRNRRPIACFGTEEEAVSYAGFLARAWSVERLQVLESDGSVAFEDWLFPQRL